jgi:hypothetical protein
MRLTMAMTNNQITEQILDLMRRDDSVDAPRDSVKWAKNVFRSRMAESKATIGQRILAVLQMEIAPNRAAFGERSGGTGQARQMLFDAGDNSIDLRITATDGVFDVRGQVLGAGFAGCSIVLSAGTDQYTGRANERSEFKVTGIGAGTYSLTLRSGERELSIEGLELS